MERRDGGDSRRHAYPPEWWITYVRERLDVGDPGEVERIAFVLLSVVRLLRAASHD